MEGVTGQEVEVVGYIEAEELRAMLQALDYGAPWRGQASQT